MPRSKPFPIAETEQLEALSSPVRQEIVDALQALGPATVANLAVELGRPADALYYHLKVLLRVGLLRETGVREDGARPETIYDLPGRPVRMRYDADPRVRRAIQRTVASVLRLAERDFAAALERAKFRGGRPTRPLVGGRFKAWLDDAQIARLQELLEEIEDLMVRGTRAPDAKPYALTRVLVSLEPHERPRARSTRRASRKDR
jgi:DNA-binding transcriptional ArsR family regulator